MWSRDGRGERELRADHYACVLRFLLLPITLLGGCDALPRDTDGTSDRIARTGTIRAGLSGAESPEATRFLAVLAQATGARVERQDGALETLVDALDHDRIDVIVGPVRADGLLADEVALGPPLDGSDDGDRPVAARAAVRNGENRWVMTVEHASRASAGR